MHAAAEVRSAYLEQEERISDQIMAAPPGKDGALASQYRAALMQTEAAHKQMWIIHEEESGK